MSENSNKEATLQSWIAPVKELLSGMSRKEQGISTIPIFIVSLIVFNSEKIPKPYLGYALIFSLVLCGITWGYILIQQICKEKENYQNLKSKNNDIKALQSYLEQRQNELEEAMIDYVQYLEKIKEQVNSINKNIKQAVENRKIEDSEASKLSKDLEDLVLKIESQQKDCNSKAGKVREAEYFFSQENEDINKQILKEIEEDPNTSTE